MARSGAAAGNFYRRGGGERDAVKVDGPARLRVNNSFVVRESLLRSLGIGQLPLLIAGEALAARRLVPVLEGWQPQPVPVHAVYPSNRYLSPKVRAFIDLALTRFPSDHETARDLLRKAGARGSAPTAATARSRPISPSTPVDLPARRIRVRARLVRRRNELQRRARAIVYRASSMDMKQPRVRLGWARSCRDNAASARIQGRADPGFGLMEKEPETMTEPSSCASACLAPACSPHPACTTWCRCAWPTAWASTRCT